MYYTCTKWCAEQVLTVYLFDLARDHPLLLDREVQVAAFDDMVIAVQVRFHFGQPAPGMYDFNQNSVSVCSAFGP